MIVTRFHYPMEKKLLEKIELQIKRCTGKQRKRDSVLVVEGPEGEGKTTFSVAIAYYVSERTGRPFDHNHVFFDAQKMMDFLKNTDEQIAIWDEPALSGLSKDAMTKIVKNIERLLMMCRKKRHFIIFNIAYFNRFNDYIVWQRPRGMIHIYTRPDTEESRFVYIRKKYLEKLWNDWRRKRQRNYFKYACRGVKGSFPDVLNPDYKNNVLSEFDYDFYDKEKDKAIGSVGVTEDKRDLKQIKHGWMVNAIKGLQKEKINISNHALSELFEVNIRTIQLICQEIRQNESRKLKEYIINGDSKGELVGQPDGEEELGTKELGTKEDNNSEQEQEE